MDFGKKLRHFCFICMDYIPMICSTSQELYTQFWLSCFPNIFTHTLQGYFTGTWAIIWWWYICIYLMELKLVIKLNSLIIGVDLISFVIKLNITNLLCCKSTCIVDLMHRGSESSLSYIRHFGKYGRCFSLFNFKTSHYMPDIPRLHHPNGHVRHDY